MKSMIWKELRENFKWAALAFFCLLLAEVFVLSSRHEMVGDRFGGVTLCSNAFLMVSAFGCSAVGAVLGALQILPELRRDQWASLLHRPIPRHVILLGKAGAGLALYGLATGLPLLVSVAHVALPGHFAAPFVPGLAAPAASDLLLGMVFYFTAILLGLHSGRWFGSRGAIALGAVGVMAGHLAGGWPFALPLGAAVALFVAAWGAMLGSLVVRPWISRMALGVVILAGAGTGLLLIGAALRAAAQRPILPYGSEDFFIEHDGTVLLRKQDGKKGFVMTDEQGNVVPKERYSGNNSGLYSLFPYPLANRESAKARRFERGSRSSDSRVELVSGDNNSPELWYRIAGRHSYFIGYDTLSARCIGICDADGFKNPGAIPRPFASEPQSEPIQAAPILFWVGPQVFAVDFTERQMTLLLDAKGDAIYGASKFPYISEHPRIAIALRSTVQILDLTGAPIYTLAYGYDSKLSPNVSITATDNFSRTFLLYSLGFYFEPKNHAVPHLDVMDSQGRRIAAYAMPETDFRPDPPTWGARIADLLIMPVPALGLKLWNSDNGFNASLGLFGSTILFELDRAEFYALFGLALILGVIACLWSRRAGLSTARTVIWVILTIVFGLAGFLAYRISTNWPVLVRCHRCAQRRPVNAADCPHCHEPWEPLPASGAEIFGPA